MIRTNSILFFAFFIFFQNVSGQFFNITLHRDYLNDGKQKSLLFSDERGEILHFINLNPEGFKKDLDIKFDRTESSKVHLTIFKRRFRLAGGSFGQKRFASTFCDLQNNSTMTYFDLGEVDKHEPGIPQDEYDTKTVEIKGVYSLEDIVENTTSYTILSKKVKKDSVLKLNVRFQSEKDALIFIKINGDNSYSQLYLIQDGISKVKLMKDDLTDNIKELELNLPYPDHWNTRVTGVNTDSEQEFPIHLSIRPKEKIDFITYPIPEDVSPLQFVVNLDRRDPETKLRHNYHQISEHPPTEIFHYDQFDFELKSDPIGFVLNVNDESDYFEIKSSYTSSVSKKTLFHWYFYGETSRKGIKIVYPKEIPAAIKNFVGGNWETAEQNIYDLTMIKLADSSQEINWESPIDYFQILKGKSYHRCIEYFFIK